jgi:hypothetical protein
MRLCLAIAHDLSRISRSFARHLNGVAKCGRITQPREMAVYSGAITLNSIHDVLLERMPIIVNEVQIGGHSVRRPE